MYSYILCVYGHQVKDAELSDLISENQFSLKFGKNEYEAGDVYNGGELSPIIGTIFCTSDDNETFLTEVREAREEEFASEYREFLQAYVEHLKSEGMESQIAKLVNFCKDNRPGFYHIDATS